jgi:hypothetical protein
MNAAFGFLAAFLTGAFLAGLEGVLGMGVLYVSTGCSAIKNKRKITGLPRGEKMVPD